MATGRVYASKGDCVVHYSQKDYGWNRNCAREAGRRPLHDHSIQCRKGCVFLLRDERQGINDRKEGEKREAGELSSRSVSVNAVDSALQFREEENSKIDNGEQLHPRKKKKCSPTVRGREDKVLKVSSQKGVEPAVIPLYPKKSICDGPKIARNGGAMIYPCGSEG